MSSEARHLIESEATASAAAPALRGSLDEKLWTYHDQYHCGAYAECQACSDVWHWETFADVPRYRTQREERP